MHTLARLGVWLAMAGLLQPPAWPFGVRVTARIDPSGNRTEWGHDHRDRVIRQQQADGTERRYLYSCVSELIETVDEAGTVITRQHDALSRLVARTISTQGLPDVPGYQPRWEAFAHDGLSRPITAEDDDSRVDRFFDTLSRIRKETQQIGNGARPSPLQTIPGAPRSVFFTHDGVGK